MSRDSNEPQPREGIDGPFGALPEASLYRCPVRGKDGVINEEIIDVTTGTAQFHGDDQGGVPKLGCPDCHGDTMAYVEKDK